VGTKRRELFWVSGKLSFLAGADKSGNTGPRGDPLFFGGMA
jgi:hypothetical protein